MGALQALGVKFFDRNKKELGFGGSGLIKLDFIDAENIHQGVRDTEIFIACDVDNPLYGKNGAAFVYAPQKGADSSQVVLLDSGLRNFSSIVKNQFGRDVSRIKGAGAAGGLGAGLAAFLNAKIKSGTDLIITATELESKIKDADLVITGEGAMDFQTFFGKTPFGVASLAAKYGISVITINGSVDIDYNKIKKSQLDLFSGNFDIINRAMNIGEAMSSAEANLYRCVKEITKFYLRTVGAD
jgi:glycerate kinase